MKEKKPDRINPDQQAADDLDSDAQNNSYDNSHNSSHNNSHNSDFDLFRETMQDVKPLNQDKIDPDSGPKIKKTKRIVRESRVPSIFGELDYAPSVEADETLSFARGGIQQKTISKLKKGQLPIEAKVDLHGLTIDNAGSKLQMAIANAQENQKRCILVIHGRGKGSFDQKPVIKTHVNQWLRDSEKILAFHSAQPHHGGTGAVYVLVKRIRDKS